MRSPFKQAYFKLYQFIAIKRLEAQDTRPAAIHTFLTIVLTTSLLMWSYSLVALTTINSYIPGIVGTLCSLIHLLSPLIFRVSKSTTWAGNVMLTAGMIHQGTFSYYTGGFAAHTLIWFGILPMLGGLINGRKGTTTWTIATTTMALLMLGLQIYGHVFPNIISENGRLLAQMLLVFGWIFLSSTIITVFIVMKDQSEQLLGLQSKKIDDLVRVLFHDLANPLGRISIGLNITKKYENPEQTQRGIDIASQATEAMIEITQNVRKMYAMSKGKADMDIQPFLLNEGIEYVRKVCHDEMEKKKITLHYDEKAFKNLNVMVEQVSFKNQVLCNIISNSIKFSSEGKSIYITAKPLNAEFVEIIIKDEGIGMPPSILENLFEINRKTTRAGTKGEMGTGFGMHIMKSFMEMYEGNVQVESQEGTEGKSSGSLFKLRLKYNCINV
jgi:signal transduction histidine kinase